MDSILPNKEPYKPRLNQRTTIVFGKPIYFDDLVKELKNKQKTSVKLILEFKKYFQKIFDSKIELIKSFF